MSGKHLLVGFVVMGIVVPTILFFFLELATATEFFIVAVTCFLAWGLADLAADILSRPRLENRSPGTAIREIEVSGGDEKDPSI
ncbi:MAG TPA: hypothetical protein VMS56_07050 [Thermoanaerobaculia bacterium]|nr:hypothetical protein [Thermoanaerobaculia bacterium]